MVFAATTLPSTVSNTVAVPPTGTWFVTTTETVEAWPASFAVTVGVAYESTGGDAMMPYQARATSPFGAATTTRFSTTPDEAPKTKDALPVASVTFWNGPLNTVAPTTGLPGLSVAVTVAVAVLCSGTGVLSTEPNA